MKGAKVISNSVYFEGSLNYNRIIKEKHNISGMLVGILRELKYANNGNLQTSLPYRNIGHQVDLRMRLIVNILLNLTSVLMVRKICKK